MKYIICIFTPDVSADCPSLLLIVYSTPSIRFFIHGHIFTIKCTKIFHTIFINLSIIYISITILFSLSRKSFCQHFVSTHIYEDEVTVIRTVETYAFSVFLFHVWEQTANTECYTAFPNKYPYIFFSNILNSNIYFTEFEKRKYTLTLRLKGKYICI